MIKPFTIDIPDAKVRKGDLPPLLFNYQPGPLAVVDDGRMIQANIAPGSFLSVDGKRYQLTAIEFHKPSEIKVNGKGSEMAAHLLHKDKDGRIAVLAMGGFTSAPPVLAGNLFRARTCLHESNTIPGRANRLLARLVDRAFIGFPGTAELLRGAITTCTGTPARSES